jgi:TctA family transporter
MSQLVTATVRLGLVIASGVCGIMATHGPALNTKDAFTAILAALFAISLR